MKKNIILAALLSMVAISSLGAMQKPAKGATPQEIKKLIEGSAGKFNMPKPVRPLPTPPGKVVLAPKTPPAPPSKPEHLQAVLYRAVLDSEPNLEAVVDLLELGAPKDKALSLYQLAEILEDAYKNNPEKKQQYAIIKHLLNPAMSKEETKQVIKELKKMEWYGK